MAFHGADHSHDGLPGLIVGWHARKERPPHGLHYEVDALEPDDVDLRYWHWPVCHPLLELTTVRRLAARAKAVTDALVLPHLGLLH